MNDTPNELVMVVDANDKPFAVMPLADVQAQNLLRRAVLIAVHDKQNRLYLQKRSARKAVWPSRYDLSATGHVKAFESVVEAAKRELWEELGLCARTLVPLAKVQASPLTGMVFTTLFDAGRIPEEPKPDPDELDGGFFVDKDELDYLVRDHRDQLTPGLVHFAESGLLFTKQPL